MDVEAFLWACAEYEGLGSIGQNALEWLVKNPSASPARFHEGTLTLLHSWIELALRVGDAPELRDVQRRIEEYFDSPTPSF